MNSAAKHQIVIVGGGSAGISVAARLKRALEYAQITIIEPSDKHYYQPLWTLAGGGICDKKESERSEAGLIPSGVRWIRDFVTEFRPTENKVITRAGDHVGYDFLVVAAGIQIDWHKIKNLQETIGCSGVCSNYSYEFVDKTWQFIRGFKAGNAVFTQPSSPIKCGGAPQKICYLAEDYFRQKGKRDGAKVVFISGTPVIFAVQKYAQALTKHIAETGIQTKFKHDLREIRPSSREAVFENLETNTEFVQKYDLLHVTPPMSAPDFIKQSDLADGAGWVEVDKFTLQHKRFPNIFGLGDSSNLPTSKTGAAIRKQAPVAAANLINLIKNQPLAASYNGYTSCPLVTGYDSLILAEFDYDQKPQETFPFDQSKERYSMFLLKRYLLPRFYWSGMLRGRA